MLIWTWTPRATIFKALEQIHNAGICHNDVRIDNIVVNQENEIAIIDFDRATFPKRPADFEKELAELRSTVYCDEESASETSGDGGSDPEET